MNTAAHSKHETVSVTKFCSLILKKVDLSSKMIAVFAFNSREPDVPLE